MTEHHPLSTGRPDPAEVDSDYVRSLIDAVEGDDVLRVLESQRPWLRRTSQQIAADQVNTVHPPYGWTVRQVIEHLADAERVFGYRMLRFAAGDPTPLPGWDENAFAAAGFGAGDGFAALVEELDMLRAANLLLLRRLPVGGWDRGGVASGSRISVRGIAWMAAGHFQHHLRIVQQRVGIS